jgi:hypothetical protein
MIRYKIHRLENGSTGLFRGKQLVLWGDWHTIYILRRALDAMRQTERGS